MCTRLRGRSRAYCLPIAAAGVALLLAAPAAATTDRPAGGSRAAVDRTTKPTPLATNLDQPLQIAATRDAIYVSQDRSPRSDYPVITKISRDGHQTDIVKESDPSDPHAGTITGIAVRHATIAYLVHGVLEERLPGGHTVPVANLTRFEKSHNPDAANTYGFVGLSDDCRNQLNADPEGDYSHSGLPYTGTNWSLPYALANAPGGGWYVADELANDVLHVSPNGRIRVVYVGNPQPVVVTAAMAKAVGIPDCTAGHTLLAEASPTDVVVTRSGKLLVTLLPGGDDVIFIGDFYQWEENRIQARLGARGSVVQVDPKTGRKKRIAHGLREPTGVALGPHGRIYVSELYGPALPTGVAHPGGISVIRDNGTPRRIYNQELPGPPIALEYSRGRFLLLAASWAPSHTRLYSVTP
jgi:hypothetical protein